MACDCLSFQYTIELGHGWTIYIPAERRFVVTNLKILIDPSGKFTRDVDSLYISIFRRLIDLLWQIAFRRLIGLL